MAKFHSLEAQVLVACVLFLNGFGRNSAMGASIDPQMKEAIDDFIKNKYLPANNNPALSLALTSGNGSLLYTTGYGLMDVANELPTTNDTFFLLGSISKSFASVVVCKILHEKFPELGKNVLDTPIRKLIPEFNFTLNDRYRSEITTFRDMLSHRVCSKPDAMATLMLPYKSSGEVAYRQRYAEEQCSFRTEFVYNNGMYTLASEVIAAIASRPYENLLADLFFDIGMLSSTVVRDNDPDDFPNRAIPYYWKDGERHNFNPKLLTRVSIAQAAGGIMTNAIDMSKYLQLHLNKGRVGDRQVVPENVMEWLYEVSNHFPLEKEEFQPHGTGVRIGYALGLFHSVLDGWQRIYHAGNVPPFHSELSFYPATNIGIFSSTNQMPVNPAIYHPHLHSAIFDILRREDPSKITEKFQTLNRDGNKAKFENKDVETVVPSEEELDKYIGVYGNGLEGEIEITTKTRTETNTTELYMNFGEWGKAYLLGTETSLNFLVIWDSDVVQDRYAMGLPDNDTFVIFNEDITDFQIIDYGVSTLKLVKGLSLDILPPVPWSPESCGPENNI